MSPSKISNNSSQLAKKALTNTLNKKESLSSHLKSGVISINGHKFHISSNVSLKGIIEKINIKSGLTGVKASLDETKSKIILTSKKEDLHIIDCDAVLLKLYKNQKIGNNEKCLIYCKSANPGKQIKFHYLQETQGQPKNLITDQLGNLVNNKENKHASLRRFNNPASNPLYQEINLNEQNFHDILHEVEIASATSHSSEEELSNSKEKSRDTSPSPKNIRADSTSEITTQKNKNQEVERASANSHSSEEAQDNSKEKSRDTSSSLNNIRAQSTPDINSKKNKDTVSKTDSLPNIPSAKISEDDKMLFLCENIVIESYKVCLQENFRGLKELDENSLKDLEEILSPKLKNLNLDYKVLWNALDESVTKRGLRNPLPKTNICKIIANILYKESQSNTSALIISKKGIESAALKIADEIAKANRPRWF